MALAPLFTQAKAEYYRYTRDWKLRPMEIPGLPQLIYQLRWSPPIGMYIASTVQYPEITYQHDQSTQVIQWLKDKLQVRLGGNAATHSSERLGA